MDDKMGEKAGSVIVDIVHKPEYKVEIDSGAEIILDILSNNGYEAYVVGGCLRDTIRNSIFIEQRSVNDWDICSAATPEEVKELFTGLGYKVIETSGIKHGTIIVMVDDEVYEVTTFRVDGKYTDGRRPDSVEFTSSIGEDLKRRDFTINAMAWSKSTGLVAPESALSDLLEGKLTAVGDPYQRFSEDALRILRAIRFACRYGLKIEDQTEKAMLDLKDNLRLISSERISEELLKILSSPKAAYYIEKYVTILEVFIPELSGMVGFEQHNKHHCYDVFKHTIKAIESLPDNIDIELKLMALLHDIAKPLTLHLDEENEGHFYGHCKAGAEMAYNILHRLKMPNSIIDRVARVIEQHDLQIEHKSTVRRLLNRYNEQFFADLFILKMADIAAQSTYNQAEKLSGLENMIALYESVLADTVPFKKSDLAINGRDLIAHGFEPGVTMGKILDSIYEKVISDELKNTRDDLLEFAINYKLNL